LTGARVSEAIEYLRVNDIEYKTHITEENNKSVVRKVGVFNVVTLKRRDKPKRKIPILYSDSRSAEAFKIENAMIEYIKLFTNKMLMEEKIFRCKRDSATNYFKKHIQFKVDATYKGKRISIDYKMHCHYLRHCRVTHMRETHGFDILDLKQFTGWTSTAMTDRYLHAGWKSLMEKMIKNG
jgi:site-specific recombinase XerD